MNSTRLTHAEVGGTGRAVDRAERDEAEAGAEHDDLPEHRQRRTRRAGTGSPRSTRSPAPPRRSAPRRGGARARAARARTARAPARRARISTREARVEDHVEAAIRTTPPRIAAISSEIALLRSNAGHSASAPTTADVHSSVPGCGSSKPAPSTTSAGEHQRQRRREQHGLVRRWLARPRSAPARRASTEARRIRAGSPP